MGLFGLPGGLRQGTSLVGLLAALSLSAPVAGCGPDRCDGLACLDHAVGLATDEQYLYYLTHTGALGRIEKGGGDLETLIPGGDSPRYGMVREGRELFWLADAGLMRASVDGGAASVVAPADEFAVDAESIYVFAVLSDAPPPRGDIVRLPRAGGPSQLLVHGVRVQRALAAGGGFLYYDHLEWDGVSTPDFGIWRVPLVGGAPERIADGSPRRIFVTGDRALLCLTDSTLGVLEGGQIRTLNLDCPNVVDGDQLFGSRENSSSPIVGSGPPPTVWGATLAGEARMLVTASGTVWTLTADDQYVYYADEQHESGWHGRLSRVHR